VKVATEWLKSRLATEWLKTPIAAEGLAQRHCSLGVRMHRRRNPLVSGSPTKTGK
jgi:hypothetical protein